MPPPAGMMMSGPYSPIITSAKPGYTPAHGMGNVRLMCPHGASLTNDVRSPSSIETMGIDDHMVGVSIMSAPHSRHNLASTGQAICFIMAIMCEACSMTGT